MLLVLLRFVEACGNGNVYGIFRLTITSVITSCRTPTRLRRARGKPQAHAYLFFGVVGSLYAAVGDLPGWWWVKLSVVNSARDGVGRTPTRAPRAYHREPSTTQMRRP